jgi:cytoskeletal protein RodZ
MVFVMRKLDRSPQTLGEKLRALRKGQAVTLDMLVERTQIQRKYLEALERGRYDALPDPVYARQFVKLYATVLGADVSYFLELYNEECGRSDLITPNQMPRRRLQRRFLTSPAQMVGYGLAACASLILIGYLLFQLFGVFLPPQLSVDQPQEDRLVVSSPILVVEGSVEDGSTVFVNGQTIPTTAEQLFRTEVPLDLGVNEIIIEAVRRYSARSRIKKIVVYSDSSTGAQ